MKKRFQLAAATAALLLTVGLAACGQAGSSAPAEPSSQTQESAVSQESGSPAGGQEESRPKAEDPELTEFQVPNGSASIQLPSKLSAVDGGLDNTLVATDGSVVVTLTVADKAGLSDEEALDKVQKETREMNVQQGGVQPVEQEDPQLPFATAFRGDLYEGVTVESLYFTLYTAHFTTQDSVVVCELLTPRDSWEGERETLLGCLDTFQEL